MFLETLPADLDRSLDRLKANKLASYDRIQRLLLVTDVRSEAEFQRIFNDYYRIRRPSLWREYFYAVLEREKRSPELSFNLVLRELHAATGRLEASFTSKLVATVRPNLPVYDRFVREALCLPRVPSSSSVAERRIIACTAMYDEPTERVQSVVRTEQFMRFRAAFDARFSEYRHFSDVKKLDLLLWQYRSG